MEPIKISVDINIGERTEAFLTKLFAGVMTTSYAKCEDRRPQVEVTASKEAPKVEPEVKKPSAPAAKPAVSKPVVSPAPSAPAARAASSAADDSNLSITDVRKLLVTKVNAHREAIKAKLEEYGVANVTTLPEENYSEFYTFLNSL